MHKLECGVIEKPMRSASANSDPRWAALYAAEVDRLRAVLPAELICVMEHFGSTAIPGLIAKPIIDILAAVTSVDQARRTAVAPLESLGYAFWADNPKSDRLFFVKGLPPASRIGPITCT